MRQRDAVLKEAVEASITYCGRVDESFVLSYVTELVAQERHRREPRQPLLACGSWKAPDSAWMPKDAKWLHIPLPENLALWMNVAIGGYGMALIPRKSGGLDVVTPTGSVTVPDDPYWLFVRYRSLAPIIASYGIAVSPESHNESRNIILLMRRPLYDSVYLWLASPANGARDFFRDRRKRFKIKEPRPTRIQDKNFNMENHLAIFYKELEQIYGDVAPDAGTDGVKMQLLDEPAILALIAVN